MALFKFVRAIQAGRPIEIFAEGRMERDFTYIDDIVRAVTLLVQLSPPADGEEGVSPSAPFRLINIGLGAPVGLMQFVEEIERALGRRANRCLLPRPPGEVLRTYADTGLLQRLTGFRPQVEVREGIAAFVAWYRDYYGA